MFSLGFITRVRLLLGFPYRDRLLAIVGMVLQHHLDTLIRVRAESIYYDGVGRLDSPEWRAEINRFLDSQVFSSLMHEEQVALDRRRMELSDVVAARVAEAAARLPMYSE